MPHLDFELGIFVEMYLLVIWFAVVTIAFNLYNLRCNWFPRSFWRSCIFETESYCPGEEEFIILNS